MERNPKIRTKEHRKEASLQVSKEIKPVNPKGNQHWIFIGRTDAEAETPILWATDAKNWLIGKDPDSGKDWGQEEKRVTEDEMVGWNQWLNGHEFEQTPGDSDGQGSLECYSPWDHRVERDLAAEQQQSLEESSFDWTKVCFTIISTHSF